ncbi:MAG: NAD(P)/FAD-dependent oxidoreductase [Streptococcaceae bacterium]|nr:NAD(P)/FAD-dependent oxidoreductase [Streptococcaceae bacterium]
MNTFDIIVVGAGPSGMMAAITAAEHGTKVALIDKNKKVGKKLLLTGGGRCNVTNNKSIDDLIENIPGNGRFLYSSFSQFDNQDIIAFFAKSGIKLKEEDHGRMFPTTNKSTTIVNTLFERLLSLGVTYIPQTKVIGLTLENGQITGLKTESESYHSKAVILATGGRTYPSTGSTGDGYKMAKSAGHTLTKLYPTESPLISSEPFIKDKILQGISLQNIKLSVLNTKGKTIVSHELDLLFTHFGLSGPAALRCSSFVNQELDKGANQVKVQLDLFPNQSTGALKNQLIEIVKTSHQSVKNAFTGLTQERLLLFFLEQAGLDKDTPVKSLTDKEIYQLIDKLKGFTIHIDKTFPLEKSFVTGGGVNLKEINPKTMESKLTQGLYMTGELLDINGYTGGYNITAAFSTGYVAGLNSAQSI